MVAICVEDEYLLLNNLIKEVKKTREIDEAIGFDYEEDAIVWANENRFDIAFLDIRMHEEGGLRLAEKLRTINPKVIIIFCTGYREFGYEALKLHSDGYLLKPIHAEQIQAELDYLVSVGKINTACIMAKCYGSFEAYDRYGNVLNFKRSLSKELLAYLIHRNGMMVSADEICKLFWGEYDYSRKDYFKKIFYELKRVLEEATDETIIINSAGYYGVDISKIKFIDKDKGNSKYMQEYQWANS